MDKKKVIQFFDQCASWWDDDMIRNEDIICKILDNCEINQNSKVLDVACGTGVLFEDYLKRKVSSLTGIDISSEMVKIAKWIRDVINDFEGNKERVSKEVQELCEQFPIY